MYEWRVKWFIYYQVSRLLLLCNVRHSRSRVSMQRLLVEYIELDKIFMMVITILYRIQQYTPGAPKVTTETCLFIA